MDLAPQSPSHHANNAQPASPAQLDLPVLLASPEPPDHLVKVAELLHQAHLDPKDHLDHPALLETPVHLALLDNLLLLAQSLPESLDHLAMLDLLALLVNLVPPDKAELAHPDPKAHPDLLEPPDNLATTALPATLVLPELAAREVSARNTAPSTVVFSSRMEQDVAKHSAAEFLILVLFGYFKQATILKNKT